jgi:hypothetical protein
MRNLRLLYLGDVTCEFRLGISYPHLGFLLFSSAPLESSVQTNTGIVLRLGKAISFPVSRSSEILRCVVQVLTLSWNQYLLNRGWVGSRTNVGALKNIKILSRDGVTRDRVRISWTTSTDVATANSLKHHLSFVCFHRCLVAASNNVASSASVFKSLTAAYCFTTNWALLSNDLQQWGFLRLHQGQLSRNSPWHGLVCLAADSP